MKSIEERKYKCSFCHQITMVGKDPSQNAIRVGKGEESVVYCLNCIDKQFISNFKMKEVIEEAPRKTSGKKCINKTKEENKEGKKDE